MFLDRECTPRLLTEPALEAVLRLLAICMAGCICAVAPMAAAQDARWAVRTTDATGSSEAIACASARARAQAEARKYLGLNIRGCSCAPEVARGGGSSTAYRCRVNYEVLVRTNSN